MKKTATYEDWQRLFRKETGRHAGEAKYNPAPPIHVPVYIDTSAIKTPAPESESGPKALRIKHHLIISEPEKTLSHRVNTLHNHYHISTDEYSDTDSVLHLDHGAVKKDFHVLKNWCDRLTGSDKEIRHFPDDDFLLNISLIKGIRKYLSQYGPKTILKTSVYIPLSRIPHSEKEDQLIPLTNRLLSAAAAGISHFTWDLRGLTSWQEHNLSLLLNIPEILHRESHLYSRGDATEGSAFFESLAEEIFLILRDQ